MHTAMKFSGINIIHVNNNKVGNTYIEGLHDSIRLSPVIK